MREPHEATIPIRLAQSDVVDHKPEPLPKKKLGWKMRRTSIIVICSVLTFAVGWGGWTYFGSPTKVEDDDFITDVDGFNSAPPVLGAPAGKVAAGPSLGSPGAHASLSETGALLPAPPMESLASAPSPAMKSMSIDGPIRSAEVWLTGTIEDAETMELPQRISGGAPESSIVR